MYLEAQLDGKSSYYKTLLSSENKRATTFERRLAEANKKTRDMKVQMALAVQRATLLE